jgi:hypothetical protein
MKTSIKIFHWLPRILCILAILFVSMFSFDVFEAELTFWQQILALLIHLIPSFILLALLIIAWKWEKLGGIIFAIIGLGTSPFIFLHNYNVNHFPFWDCMMVVALINLPFVIVGVLFIFSNHLRKKIQRRDRVLDNF